MTTLPAQSTGPVPARPSLEPTGIASMHASLVSSLECSDDLTARECAESLRELEKLICTATAAQARLAVRLDQVTRADAIANGEKAGRSGRGVGAQVAFARRVSPHRGRALLGLATVVCAEMPHTWRAWQRGRITEWKATLLARETACLSLADRLTIDHELASDADRLEAMGPRELAATASALAAHLDPEAVVARRRKAEADRHVSLRPAPDTMTWFSALLPVKDGVAVFAALKQSADVATGIGDPRGRGQVMADTLVARVTGREPDQAPQVSLNLTMSDTSLFGDDEDAAHLDGYGPIPAELGRELVHGHLSEVDEIDVRRLFTRPDTGQLQAMESRARRFRGNLARFIRLRDRVCRTPWCEAPIRDLDHAAEHQSGGPTSTTNGQGLCRACDLDKTARGWRAGPAPDGSIATTMPTGLGYLTRPPVIATIRPSPIRIDYLMAG